MFRTGNPALRGEHVPRGARRAGRRGDDPSGHGQQDRPLPAHPAGRGRFHLEQPVPQLFIWIGLIGGLVTALVTVFKKTWAPYHHAPVRRLRGAAPGRPLAVVRAALSGHRHECGGPDLRDAGRAARRVLDRPHPSERELQARHRSPRPAPSASCISCRWSWASSASASLSSTAAAWSASGSACSWSADRRAEPRARLRLHRARGGRGRAQVHGVVGAFGLLVTLVWLYLEILRLLAKIMGSKAAGRPPHGPHRHPERARRGEDRRLAALRLPRQQPDRAQRDRLRRPARSGRAAGSTSSRARASPSPSCT